MSIPLSSSGKSGKRADGAIESNDTGKSNPPLHLISPATLSNAGRDDGKLSTGTSSNVGLNVYSAFP